MLTIAIMSAMAEENASLIGAMTVAKQENIGGRQYYTGELFGQDVVVVFSHWGKVAAAITATTLICHYDLDEIIFTGVAGGLTGELDIGDLVVGMDTYQHDMDVRPIIARHEIPLLGRAYISTSEQLRNRLVQAGRQFINLDFPTSVGADIAAQFSITSPKVVCADIASGDQFIDDAAIGRDIRQRLSTVMCVEMEGAAVAQVCESFQVPFGLVRTISDGANEESHWDFSQFIEQIAQAYTLGIVRRYLSSIVS